MLGINIVKLRHCVSEQVTVSEHLPAGSSVITVTATDHDSGENGKVTYKVMSSTKGVFFIDPSNGKKCAHFRMFVTMYCTLTENNPGLWANLQRAIQGAFFGGSLSI